MPRLAADGELSICKPQSFHGGSDVKSVAYIVCLVVTLHIVPRCASAEPTDTVLLNFTSPHCTPCRTMKPVLDSLESQGTPIRHIDVLQEPHLAGRFGIRKTPTFIVLASGKELTRLVGAQRIETLKNALKSSSNGPLVPTGSKLIQDQRQEFASNIAGVDSRGLVQPLRLGVHSGDIASANASVTSIPNANHSEVMPNVQVADAIERARAATVRLRVYDSTGYSVGTGTIIDCRRDEALIFTCGHLFREVGVNGRVDVDLFHAGQSHTVSGKVIDYDANGRDVALVAIKPGFPVKAVEVVRGNQTIRNGEVVFSFGCDRGAAPSRRDTRITGVNKYDQHLGLSNLEIDGAPIDGRSGGGLFDLQGRLIGVCNSADYQNNVGIFAGPGSISWQLARIGLLPMEVATRPADTRTATINETAEAKQKTLFLPQAGTNQAISEVITQKGGSEAREVVVIVRDRNANGFDEKVMTLRDPSPDMMNMIYQHANQ